MARKNINPKNPPILWSTVKEAFDDINANFQELYENGVGGTGAQGIQGAQGISGTGMLSSRTTIAGTAVNLANTETANVDIVGYKGYVLYKIQTSHAAWVRIYTDNASRAADAGRLESVDPSPSAGIENRYLFYYKERNNLGTTWPKVNYFLRSGSKISYPKTTIRRTR